MITEEERNAIVRETEAKFIKNFAEFWQMTNYDAWQSPEGRCVDDLGNGLKVGEDLAKYIIKGEWTHDKARQAVFKIAKQMLADRRIDSGFRLSAGEVDQQWNSASRAERDELYKRATVVYQMATRA